MSSQVTNDEDTEVLEVSVHQVSARNDGESDHLNLKIVRSPPKDDSRVTDMPDIPPLRLDVSTSSSQIKTPVQLHSSYELPQQSNLGRGNNEKDVVTDEKHNKMEKKKKEKGEKKKKEKGEKKKKVKGEKKKSRKLTTEPRKERDRSDLSARNDIPPVIVASRSHDTTSTVAVSMVSSSSEEIQNRPLVSPDRSDLIRPHEVLAENIEQNSETKEHKQNSSSTVGIRQSYVGSSTRPHIVRIKSSRRDSKISDSADIESQRQPNTPPSALPGINTSMSQEKSAAAAISTGSLPISEESRSSITVVSTRGDAIENQDSLELGRSTKEHKHKSSSKKKVGKSKSTSSRGRHDVERKLSSRSLKSISDKGDIESQMQAGIIPSAPGITTASQQPISTVSISREDFDQSDIVDFHSDSKRREPKRKSSFTQGNKQNDIPDVERRKSSRSLRSISDKGDGGGHMQSTTLPPSSSGPKSQETTLTNVISVGSASDEDNNTISGIVIDLDQGVETKDPRKKSKKDSKHQSTGSSLRPGVERNTSTRSLNSSASSIKSDLQLLYQIPELNAEGSGQPSYRKKSSTRSLVLDRDKDSESIQDKSHSSRRRKGESKMNRAVSVSNLQSPSGQKIPTRKEFRLESNLASHGGRKVDNNTPITHQPSSPFSAPDQEPKISSRGRDRSPRSASIESELRTLFQVPDFTIEELGFLVDRSSSMRSVLKTSSLRRDPPLRSTSTPPQRKIKMSTMTRAASASNLLTPRGEKLVRQIGEKLDAYTADHIDNGGDEIIARVRDKVDEVAVIHQARKISLQSDSYLDASLTELDRESSLSSLPERDYDQGSTAPHGRSMVKHMLAEATIPVRRVGDRSASPSARPRRKDSKDFGTLLRGRHRRSVSPHGRTKLMPRERSPIRSGSVQRSLSPLLMTGHSKARATFLDNNSISSREGDSTQSGVSAKSVQTWESDMSVLFQKWGLQRRTPQQNLFRVHRQSSTPRIRTNASDDEGRRAEGGRRRTSSLPDDTPGISLDHTVAAHTLEFQREPIRAVLHRRIERRRSMD